MPRRKEPLANLDLADALTKLPLELFSAGLKSLASTADIALGLADQTSENFSQVLNRQHVDPGPASQGRTRKLWTEAGLETRRDFPFLFNLSPNCQVYLDRSFLHGLRAQFRKHNINLTKNTTVSTTIPNERWTIWVQDRKTTSAQDRVYIVIKRAGHLNVYQRISPDPKADQAIAEFFQTYPGQGTEAVAHLFGLLSNDPKQSGRPSDAQFGERNPSFLFDLPSNCQVYLDRQYLPGLKAPFKKKKHIFLSRHSVFSTKIMDKRWTITDRGRVYLVVKNKDQLKVYQTNTQFGDSYINRFLEKHQSPPAWIHEGLIQKAGEIFTLYEPEYLGVLLCRALPETYACWRGAQVLAATQRLEGGGRVSHPKDGNPNSLIRRVLVTSQFVLDVMSPKGLDPTGPGIQAILKLRLIHATIRFFLHQRNWDPDLGNPINQEDLAMTFLAFSVVVFGGLEKFNIRLDENEQEALYHRWRVVGYYLGIHKDLLPDTVEDALALWDAIVLCQQTPAPTEQEARAGKDLTAALVSYMQTLLPVHVPADYPEYLIRYTTGDHIAQLLGVKKIKSLEPQILTFLARLGLGVSEFFEEHVAFIRKDVRAFNRTFIQNLIVMWNLDKPIHFYIPQTLPGGNSKLTFTLDTSTGEDLDIGILSRSTRQAFKNKQLTLSKDARVVVVQKGQKWLIVQPRGVYTIQKQTGKLGVYGDISQRPVAAVQEAPPANTATPQHASLTNGEGNKEALSTWTERLKRLRMAAIGRFTRRPLATETTTPQANDKGDQDAQEKTEE
ncbi:MAG: oxygenase MpaB family protein [bacterium]|nr:oxygenase MpaB family protein [bacterium]